MIYTEIRCIPDKHDTFNKRRGCGEGGDKRNKVTLMFIPTKNACQNSVAYYKYYTRYQGERVPEKC